MSNVETLAGYGVRGVRLLLRFFRWVLILGAIATAAVALILMLVNLTAPPISETARCDRALAWRPAPEGLTYRNGVRQIQGVPTPDPGLPGCPVAR